jgi:hypothetical protein
MKFKKGSKEAKAFMAKLRAKRKVGAIKIVEKGESKSAKPKAVYQQKRTAKGTFKGLKKIGAKPGLHKDTKSHNVNIRVLSGAKMYSVGQVDYSKLVRQFAKESKLKNDVSVILLRMVKDYDNNYKSLFKDILNNGLQSGIISELIYYSDTLRWYKKHKKAIIDMLKYWISEVGGNSPADLFGKKWDVDDYLIEETQNQNLLAWFSFEETTRELADRLGIEL